MNQPRHPVPSMPCWTGQHIGVAWVNNSFEVLEHFAGGASIDFRLQDLARPDGPALRFIDCYGGTYFNALQVRALVGELQEIRSRATEADLAPHIDSLIAFASRESPPHCFLWFIGD